MVAIRVIRPSVPGTTSTTAASTRASALPIPWPEGLAASRRRNRLLSLRHFLPATADPAALRRWGAAARRAVTDEEAPAARR
jgi:hypothetical protein